MVGDHEPCKVVGIRNGIQRQGRRGVAACAPGVTLYFLWHEATGLYYYECYVNEAYAIEKAAKTYGPSSMSDVAQAWRAETKHCQHSFKTED